MNTLVVSLNFNPGHFSHLVANYRLFEDSGYVPYLYVNPSFNAMDEANRFSKINAPSELRKLETVRAAVFWFPSLKNIFEILRLRIVFGSKIIYIYHEPFDSIRNYCKSGFRYAKIAKIVLINLVNIPILLLSHEIALPSAAALALYKTKYTWLNSNCCLIPLFFDDEMEPGSEADARKDFVSYIGTVAADHAFDRFVHFVHTAITNEWLPEQKFLIATSSVIPDRERRILTMHLQTGRIVIAEGRAMTTEEINGHYQNSLVVWNAYHRSMQSGVLPKAYMFGAAVIVLRRNANEFVDNHGTGILIDSNNDVSEIKGAVEEISRNRATFFRNCRETFLKTFYYKVVLDDFRKLLKD